jgi:hypothetical protein
MMSLLLGAEVWQSAYKKNVVISAQAAAVEACFRTRMIQHAATTAGFQRAARRYLSIEEQRQAGVLLPHLARCLSRWHRLLHEERQSGTRVAVFARAVDALVIRLDLVDRHRLQPPPEIGYALLSSRAIPGPGQFRLFFAMRTGGQCSNERVKRASSDAAVVPSRLRDHFPLERVATPLLRSVSVSV